MSGLFSSSAGGQSPFDLVVSRLDDVKLTSRGVRALCPVHEGPDSTPSLDVDRGEDGKVLIQCRSAHCDFDDIVRALGLRTSDLVVGRQEHRQGRSIPATKPKRYPTADSVAEMLHGRIGGVRSDYDYQDATGVHVGRVMRFDVEGKPKQILQARLDDDAWVTKGMLEQRPLYRLPDLLGAEAAALVFVVEGEKCADAVAKLGLVATTSSQGAQSPDKTDWSHLEGRKVIILPDQDEPGSRYADKVHRLARVAGADSVVVLPLDGLEAGGDVFDWIRLRRDAGADHEAIANELQQLAMQALAATPVESAPPETVEVYAPFPLHALPDECRRMAEEGSTAHSVDPAFFAVPMLPILAGCIGNSCRVLVKEGWSEPSVIWAATVAHSGAGKSPPLRRLLQAVEEWERPLERQHAQAVRDYEQLLAASTKGKQASLPPRPLWKGLLVQDATWEALATRLEANPRGLLMYQDELAGLFKSFNKYRSGDDREKWLSHFDAGPVRVDRKGLQGMGPAHIRIPYGAVSVVGTVQPRIALQYMQGSSEDSGLAARFRLAMPPTRPAVWSNMSISVGSMSGWKCVVDGLLGLSFDPDRGPKLIPLGPEARDMFVAYFNLNGQAAHEAGESGAEGLASELSKLRGFAARVALVLELARAAATGRAQEVESVGEQAMCSSIEITRWFEAEAKRFRRFAASKPAGACGRIEGKLCALLADGARSIGQLRNGLGRNVSAQEVRDALGRLQSRGLARPLGMQPSGPAGGRPVELWECVPRSRE